MKIVTSANPRQKSTALAWRGIRAVPNDVPPPPAVARSVSSRQPPPFRGGPTGRLPACGALCATGSLASTPCATERAAPASPAREASHLLAQAVAGAAHESARNRRVGSPSL